MRKQYADAINKSVFPGLQGGPHLNVIAAKAHAFRLATTLEFKEYQKQVVKNAALMANLLEGRRNNVLTGGTDTHLFLMNATTYGLDGMAAERLLEECGIIANRNSLPSDTSPFKPSGMRLGTPALTSRGFTDEPSLNLADLIDRVLIKKTTVDEAKKEVLSLTQQFPIVE
jgi:glycine hydroxymethyltransferase